MAVMYVDESGAFSHNDHTPYFVLSGVVVPSDNEIKKLQKAVFEYKQSNFMGRFIDAEIHTYEIYHADKDFKSISVTEMTDLLDNLYEMIRNVNCPVICVVIDKRLLRVEHPKLDVLTLAWSRLVRRYYEILQIGSFGAGDIKSDGSTTETENKVEKIVSGVIDAMTRHALPALISKPVFVDSASVAGIQVADALAYCTLQHKQSNSDFDTYWSIVYDRLRQECTGAAEGYNYIEFPK